MWKCSCDGPFAQGRWHAEFEVVCPTCGGAPPYTPDAVQVALFNGIKKLVALGRYSEEIKPDDKGAPY